MAELKSVFPDVPEERVQEAAERFFRMDREAGALVIQEGETHDAMFVVEGGQVTVTAGGFEVATLGPGAVLGEIALFTGAVRTAAVTAKTEAVFQLLSRASYLELRRIGNPVAWAIERRAVGQLGARLRQVFADIRTIAGAARGMLLDPVQTRQTPGRPVPLPRGAVRTVLADVPTLKAVDESVLDVLSASCELRSFGAGELLAKVGLKDGPLMIVVAGSVDCLLDVEEEQVRVSTLQPGDFLNLLQHVDGKPRPITFAAVDEVTVLAVPRGMVRGLLDRADAIGSALREAIIRSLSDRVNQANATYSMARLTTAQITVGIFTADDIDTELAAPSAPPVPSEPARLVAPPAPAGPSVPYVEPAPLHLGAPRTLAPLDDEEDGDLDEAPWFQADDPPDWDTWFDPTS